MVERESLLGLTNAVLAAYQDSMRLQSSCDSAFARFDQYRAQLDDARSALDSARAEANAAGHLLGLLLQKLDLLVKGA